MDLLEDDGSDTTEVCIFDFGKWLVVEFFRGRGSETRLFPNNAKNQQLLFNESRLSVKRIRCLGGDKQDYVYFWQEFWTKWLAAKQIHPNPDTEPSKTPTAEQLQNRQRKLERWQSEIERLEREAKTYCNRNNF